MKIFRGGWSRNWMINTQMKRLTLGVGVPHRSVISSPTVNGMLINLVSLYLQGDYLKGGRY